MNAEQNAEARRADWGKLLKWVFASDHRHQILLSVARCNLGKATGAEHSPNQREAMRFAGRPYWAKSMQSNGSQACRDLIAGGLLRDAGFGHGCRLEVCWDFVGALSDWQEERGLAEGEKRLDVYLREVE